MDDLIDAKIGTPEEAAWEQGRKNIKQQILAMEIELELAKNTLKYMDNRLTE